MTTELTHLDVKVEHPSPAALSRGAAAALDLVQSFEITDDATYAIGAEELQGIKAKASALDTQRKAITKPLDEAKAAVMNLFRGPLEVLGQAEGILKSKLLGYQQEVARKAAEERAAAEKAAQAERDRLQAEADALVAQGRAGEAAVKEQVAAMIVAAPPAAQAAPAAKGLATRETIEHEVVDLLALIQHVAAHPELVNLLAVDTVKLRAYVKGLGMQCNLPGVKVYPKQTIAARKG